MAGSIASQMDRQRDTSALSRPFEQREIDVGWLRVGRRHILAVPLSALLLVLLLATTVHSVTAAALMTFFVSLPAAYVVLAFWFNDARIRRTEDCIEISHRPLPLAPRRRIRLGPNAQLWVERDCYSGGYHSVAGRSRGEYRVEVSDETGRREVVLADLTSEEAVRIQQHLSA